MRRETKAFLLQSAYVEPEGLSLPAGDRDEISHVGKNLTGLINEDRERKSNGNAGPARLLNPLADRLEGEEN